MKVPFKQVAATTTVFAVFAGILLSACNNSKSDSATSADSTNARASAMPPTDSATKAAAYSFIDACVENSKATIGDEAKAFAHCKCMESQIRQQYGDTDSLTIVKLQSDSAALQKLVKQCN